MDLHRIGVIATAAGDLALSVGSALDAIHRSRRGALSLKVPTLIALAAGIAIGALATKPELRRMARDYLFRARPGSPEVAANDTAATPVSGTQPAPPTTKATANGPSISVS